MTYFARVPFLVYRALVVAETKGAVVLKKTSDCDAEETYMGALEGFNKIYNADHP